MKLKIALNSIIFILVLLVISVKAQNPGEICGMDQNSTVGILSNIPVKTPGANEYLRALFIYVVFPDDNFPSYSTSIWHNPNEATGPYIPTNPYSGTNGKLVVDQVGNKSTNFMSRYTGYTLTDYYCQMSMGQLDLIGDEVYVTLPQNSSYYIQNGYNRGTLNRYVLDYLNSTQNIDWSRYNNWSKINGEWVFSRQDGNAELIVITYRTIPGNESSWFWPSAWGGEASLSITPITFTNNGVNTTINGDNGVTCLNRGMALGRSELLMEHEIGHKLMGFYNPSIDGIHSNLGMMTPGHANTTFFMTPFERTSDNVQYLAYPSITNTTGTYTLRDFIETGDVLRIPAPGISGGYYWLSNNQKKSKYDGLSRGGKSCYEINYAEIDPICPEGKGLFVYSQDIGCPNTNTHIDIVSAEGKFNWAYDRTVYVPAQDYEFFRNGGTYPLYKTISGNRINGYDEYKKAVGSGLGNQLLTDNSCSQSGEAFLSWDDRGDGLDAFNMGYEEIFSPYSNPSTRTCNNSDNYGLTVRLLSQSARTGAVTLKLYYNDDNLALLECPPSKPKSVKTEKAYFGGPGSDAFHPRITWDANIEPDFISSTFNGGSSTPVYEVWRGYNSSCDATPTYSLLTSVANNVTEYTDNSVTLHDPNHDAGLGPCTTYEMTYSYKIVAKDNRAMSSLMSERAQVTGYIVNCNQQEEQDRIGLPGTDVKSYGISNYPNPFNPVTNIKYSLPKAGFVSIKIYDIVGKLITELVQEYKEVGSYSVTFDGSNLPSGIYYYRIETNNFVDTKRMVLVK